MVERTLTALVLDLGIPRRQSNASVDNLHPQELLHLELQVLEFADVFPSESYETEVLKSTALIMPNHKTMSLSAGWSRITLPRTRALVKGDQICQ